MKLFVIGLITALLVLSACSMKEQHDVVNINPTQAKELLESKEKLGLFVLNVHTPYEGKLEGTDAIIEEWQNLAAHQNELPKDRHTPILVYCRTGRMSTAAVQQLRLLGYKNIYHLEGGMKAWDAQGYPIIDKSFK